MVEVATADGRVWRYGPCYRPAPVERLRLRLEALGWDQAITIPR